MDEHGPQKQPAGIRQLVAQRLRAITDLFSLPEPDPIDDGSGCNTNPWLLTEKGERAVIAGSRAHKLKKQRDLALKLGYREIKSERQAYHLMRRVLKDGIKCHRSKTRKNIRGYWSPAETIELALNIRPGFWYKFSDVGGEKWFIVAHMPDRRGYYVDGYDASIRPEGEP